MEYQPYIPGTKPADAGPLSRFIPPLEEGVISRWLPLHAPPFDAAQGKLGGWLLDPFGFSPRLVLEAARAGYRVLVTVNNPITRFLLEIAANPPSESDFKAALAELETTKKGDERLGAHLQSLYQTTCKKCSREVQAEYFLWRKEADAPHARAYTCPQCSDSGERVVTQQDIDHAKQFAATDGLHRSRAFERVAKLDDDDRVYAEEAIQHYLPRPLYFLTTVINRIDGLNLTPERKRALNALILVACDAGNTLWDHPPTRPRPKQLNIPNQFREHNLWKMLGAPARPAAPPSRDGAPSREGAPARVGAKVGQPAPDFALPDVNGKMVKLADSKGKIVVLQWINPECPVCQRVMADGVTSRAQADAKAAASDVVWLFINSTAGMTPDTTKAYLEKNKSTTTALIDIDGSVGHKYGAKTTPHIFVIDDKGVLRYEGAIDDDGDGAKAKKKDKVTNFAANAVRQIKAGETVTPDSTKSYGCSVKYAGGGAGDGKRGDGKGGDPRRGATPPTGGGTTPPAGGGGTGSGK